MKTTSLCALTAAGIIVSGFALTPAPAKAADLGGSSGDLEERVAELEASVVRKGNRKVSLELYGQVNRALMMWNDGKDSDSYVVDNNLTPTRIGLKGDGKIGEGWKSGFNIEFDFTDSSSSNVFNGKLAAGGDQGKGETGPIGLRQGFWFIDNDKLGRVSLGQQSSATDDLTLINLSGAGVASDARTQWNTSFAVRPTTGAGAVLYNPTLSADKQKAISWGRISDGLDTDRGNFVRYDSPSVYGFIVSAAWGEDDQWDAALRFKKEWNSLRLAAGIGYYYQGNDGNTVPNTSWGGAAGSGGGAYTTREEIKGSASALHVPTGIYVAVSAGERFNQQVASFTPSERLDQKDASFWYIQGGIDKRFFPIGNTTLYGEYGNYSGFGVANVSVHNSANNLASSDVNRWGLGVVQKVDAAALEVYAAYQHFDANLATYTTNTKGDAATTAAPTQAFDAGIVGARVKF
jgi:hypothetical protein